MPTLMLWTNTTFAEDRSLMQCFYEAADLAHARLVIDTDPMCPPDPIGIDLLFWFPANPLYSRELHMELRMRFAHVIYAQQSEDRRTRWGPVDWTFTIVPFVMVPFEPEEGKVIIEIELSPKSPYREA